MRLALIVAVARNGVIGRDNGLPWRLPKDMGHFQRTTRGSPVIMGRRTFESMDGPLLGRVNIVLTGREDYRAEGAIVVTDFASALDAARHHCTGDDDKTAFAIGGAPIYAEALKTADGLYVTWVDADIKGDAWFPPVDWRQWEEASSASFPADADHEHAFRIAVYVRRACP